MEAERVKRWTYTDLLRLPENGRQLEDKVYRAVEKLATEQHLLPDDFVNEFLRRELMSNKQ